MKIKTLGIALLATTIASSSLTAAPTQSENKDKAGFFYAYNDTDRAVTIAVGNFFPVQYTIAPRDYRFVTVSTDNQNIHIVSVK